MMQFNFSFLRAGKYLPLLLFLLLVTALAAANTSGDDLHPIYLSERYATADDLPTSEALLFTVPSKVERKAEAGLSAASLAFTCVDPYCPPDYDVDCLADAEVDWNARAYLPHFEAHCEIFLDYTDHVDNDPPDPAYSTIITRIWTVRNDNGDEFTCEQLVKINAGQEPVVNAPADISDLSCGDSTDPSNTGEATATDVNGAVSVTFEDEVIDELGVDCYTILRTWTATNDCGSDQEVQTITVVDTEDPEFVNCPEDMTVNHLDDVPPAPINLTATDNCATDVTVLYNGEEMETSESGVTTITRSWSAFDNCDNTTVCEQIITIPPPPPLENECYALAPCMEYDSEAGTTRFTWDLCLIGDECKAISNIRFSIPCDLPKSALLESSSSMSGLKVEINGRTGNCERYDVQFEGFGDDAMKDEPNQCVTFSYLIDADLRDYVTDVAIKAGNQEGLDFPGISLNGCEATQSSSETSTTSSEDFRGTQGRMKPLVQSSNQAVDITEVAVFPNPARDLISLRFESAQEQRVNLQVYDATGRVAFSRALDAAPGSNTVELSLGNTPAGLYQMVLTPAKGERMVRSFLRLQ